MENETRKALLEIFEYMWKDEVRDWLENGEPENHIYHEVYALGCFLDLDMSVLLAHYRGE